MSWKNLKLGKKLGIGFGVVLLFLAGVGAWSVYGIDELADDAAQVIEGNRLQEHLIDIELSHLKWTNKVSRLLTDEDVNELNVPTDGRTCKFGTWLASDERKRAEELVPEIIPLLKEIEPVHIVLHASAADINAAYRQTHPGLRTALNGALNGHITWTQKIGDALVAAGDN